MISTSDRGLRQDALVLSDELQLAGFRDVSHVVPRAYGNWGTRPKRQEIEIPGLGPHAVVFFLEHVYPSRSVFRSGAKTVFVPNPEQLSEADVALAHTLCDAVLHKTHESARIWRRMTAHLPPGPEETVAGWSSRSRFVRDQLKTARRFLHVSGPLKGTDLLVEAWRRHPEWPELTVVGADYPPGLEGMDRLRFVPRATDEELDVLMTTHGVYLAPSHAEGWGHVIAEALSAGAIVLAPDAGVPAEVVGPAAVAIPRSPAAFRSSTPPGRSCRPPTGTPTRTPSGS